MAKKIIDTGSFFWGGVNFVHFNPGFFFPLRPPAGSWQRQQTLCIAKVLQNVSTVLAVGVRAMHSYRLTLNVQAGSCRC